VIQQRCRAALLFIRPPAIRLGDTAIDFGEQPAVQPVLRDRQLPRRGGLESRSHTGQVQLAAFLHRLAQIHQDRLQGQLTDDRHARRVRSVVQWPQYGRRSARRRPRRRPSALARGTRPRWQRRLARRPARSSGFSRSLVSTLRNRRRFVQLLWRDAVRRQRTIFAACSAKLPVVIRFGLRIEQTPACRGDLRQNPPSHRPLLARQVRLHAPRPLVGRPADQLGRSFPTPQAEHFVVIWRDNLRRNAEPLVIRIHRQVTWALKCPESTAMRCACQTPNDLHHFAIGLSSARINGHANGGFP